VGTLRFIRRARDLGMPIERIRLLVGRDRPEIGGMRTEAI
jgi:DNA-binding transcriptional MerR regulator